MCIACMTNLARKTTTRPMIKAAAIAPEDLPAVWPQVSHLVQQALEYDPDNTSIETVTQRLLDGRYLLILMLDDLKLLAALTVELVTTNKGLKTCNIVTAGGIQADQWTDPFLDELELLAKEQGAAKLTLMGRPGWARRLRGRGFKTTHIKLEAPIL